MHLLSRLLRWSPFTGLFYLERRRIVKFDSFEIHLGEGGAHPPIEIMLEGEWNHPVFGVLDFSRENLEEFIRNFNEDVRGQKIPMYFNHQDNEAAGWITGLNLKEDIENPGKQGIFATVDWNKNGFDKIAAGEYKYISPSFQKVWRHPETGKRYTNVLCSASLTNEPFLKGMQEVRLSESLIHFGEKTLAIGDISLEELLGRLNDLGCQVKDKIKGKKGSPSARHQISMAQKLLSEIYDTHFKSNDNQESELKKMSENAAQQAQQQIDLKEVQNELVQLNEALKLKKVEAEHQKKMIGQLKLNERAARIERQYTHKKLTHF